MIITDSGTKVSQPNHSSSAASFDRVTARGKQHFASGPGVEPPCIHSATLVGDAGACTCI